MKHTHVAIFLASAGVGVSLGLTHDADAITRRVNATACFVEDDNWDTIDTTGRIVATAAAEIRCPVPDDSYLDKKNLVVLDAYGYDGSNASDGRVSVQVCVTESTSPGGECGTAQTTSASGRGEYVLNPSLSLWQGGPATAYGYILVKLPAPSSGIQSVFRGFRVHD